LAKAMLSFSENPPLTPACYPDDQASTTLPVLKAALADHLGGVLDAERTLADLLKSDLVGRAP
jgi:hypothetical protein